MQVLMHIHIQAHLAAELLPSQAVPACPGVQGSSSPGQHSAFVFAEFYGVPVGSFFQPAQERQPSPQAFIICKFDEDALYHLLQAIDEGVEQDTPQQQVENCLRSTAH